MSDPACSLPSPSSAVSGQSLWSTLASLKWEGTYQAALTKMDWGKALLAAEQLDKGIEMLVVARNELQDLEEIFHVEQIDELLTAHDVAGWSTLRQEMT